MIQQGDVNCMIDAVRRMLGYQLPRLGPVGFKVFSRCCPKRIDTELLPGIKTTLDLSDEIQRSVYWQGKRYERATLNMLSAHGPDCCRFFDIGANFGFVSYVMLSRCDSLRIYAFEPNPTLFRTMKLTKERNTLARFTPVHAGLGSEAGEVTLHVSSVNSGHSTFGAHPGSLGLSQHWRDVPAPVLVFDEWSKSEGLPSSGSEVWLAKIDVEGREVDVLKGMSGSLSAHRFRCVCVEVNPFTLAFHGHQPVALLRQMDQFGYRPYDERGVAVSPDAVPRLGNLFFMPQ